MTTRPTGNVTYDNSDRVIVVTGGCSGIGFAICQQFAQTGATVYCLDVDEQSATNLPSGINFFHCDTTSSENCIASISDVTNAAGAIDVLVNNAAIQPPDSYKPIHEVDDELWQRMVGVNFSGYTNMARAVLPVMQTQGSGVIVNLASGQGHRTARDVGIYGPIKAANIMQARQWAVQYAREGIRVVSVSPGAINTPLVRASLAAQGGSAALANRHPQGRIGQPEEVAQAVLWLSSAHASFITGTDLEVDGGLGAFGAFADPYSPESVQE